MKQEKKSYSVDEIKKIAPGYRRKPENFNPAKAGKNRDSAPQEPKAAEGADPDHPAENCPNQRILKEQQLLKEMSPSYPKPLSVLMYQSQRLHRGKSSAQGTTGL